MLQRMRALRGGLRDQRGFVFIFFALGLVLILALSGLAIDTARGYVNKAQIAKAVDAAALAGAKNARAGAAGATALAKAISSANDIEPDGNETLTIQVRPPDDEGETSVFVHASRRIDTTFMRILGFKELNVQAQAEATVPPIDLVLVLDQSGSMVTHGAWDDLVPATKRFVEKFGDDVDRVSLVHFSTMAKVAMPLQGNFITAAKNRIDAMNPGGDTNSEEALSTAHTELKSDRVRPNSLKVIVFFTDGRPTAFRHADGKDVGGTDAILTVSTKAGAADNVLGWYKGPDQAPPSINPDQPWQAALNCHWVPTCDTGGDVWTRKDVADAARGEALANAAAIRADGILIYSIGLGDKNAEPESRPDEQFLQEIANSDGKGSGSEGGYFFVDDPAELDKVFQIVAADILARLSQ